MNNNTTEDNNEEDKDRLISMSQAAKMYGFNKMYLAQLASKGRLKAQKLGGVWITTLKDMEDYIQSRKTTGAYRDDIQIDD